MDNFIHVATLIDWREIEWHRPPARGDALYNASGGLLGYVGSWGTTDIDLDKLSVGTQIFGEY